MRPVSKKGDADAGVFWLFGIAVGTVVALAFYVGLSDKTTQTLSGVCIANLKISVREIQEGIINRLKNDGDKPVSLAVNLGDCVDRIAFLNKEDFYRGDTSVRVELPEEALSSVKCPEGYEGLILGIPKPEKDSGWESYFKSLVQGNGLEVAKKILSELIGDNFACKNLLRENYRFSGTQIIKAGQKEQKFCILASRQKGGVFTIDYQEMFDDAQYLKCKSQELFDSTK